MKALYIEVKNLKKSAVKIILILFTVMLLNFNTDLTYGMALGGNHGGNYQTGAYWPTNSNSLRQSEYNDFEKAPALKFKFSGGSKIAPVIASDGTIYYCTNNNMYAINRDGTQKWVSDGITPKSDPVIGNDGTIYIMISTEGVNVSVVAISAIDGTKLWFLSDQDTAFDPYSIYSNFYFGGSLAIGTAGEIYVVGLGTVNRVVDMRIVSDKAFVLTAINPNGTVKWKHMEKIPYEMYTDWYPYLADDLILDKAAPAVTQDGTVYASLGRTFVAVKNGALIKKDQTLGYDHSISAPVIFDNNIYCVYDAVQVRDLKIGKYVVPPLHGSVGKHNVVAVDFSSHTWVTMAELTYPRGQLAVGSEGTLYGTDGLEYLDVDSVTRLFTPSYLYALNPLNGSVKWKLNVNKPLVAAPVVTKDDVIYACSYEAGTMYAVNSNGIEKWRLSLPRPSGMAIGDKGSLYVSAGDGLYAYMGTKTVSFDVDGGSAISNREVFIGEKTTAPLDPVRTGYTFDGWYTDNSFTVPFDFANTSITTNTTIYAKWTINIYSITYLSEEHGSLTGGETIQFASYGTSGTEVTAIPDEGYHFTGWSDGVLTASRTDAITADKTVTAQFAINTYTLSYQVSDGHGTFMGVANQVIEHGGDGSEVEIFPEEGYRFTGWSDGIFTRNRTDTNVTSNKTLIANCEINQYSVKYVATSHGSIVGNSNQTVNHGSSSSEVVATPDEFYHFDSWHDGVFTANRSDTNVRWDIEAFAVFAIDTYTLSYEAAGGHGSIVGNANQTISHGANGAQVTAVPDLGYHFIGWSDGVETLSRTDLNITGSSSYVANFGLDAPMVQEAVSGNSTVDLSWSLVPGADTYELYKSISPGDYSSPFETVDSSILNYQVTGLTNGTTYYFTVIAVDGSEKSVYSNEMIGNPRTVPDAPTDVVAEAGDAKATITFAAPADNGGSAITSYEVISSPGGITASGITSPILISGLTNNTAYTFTVKAINMNGYGEESHLSNKVTPMKVSSGGSSFIQPEAMDTTGNISTSTIISKTTVSFDGSVESSITTKQLDKAVMELVDAAKLDSTMITEVKIKVDPVQNSSIYTTSIPKIAVYNVVENKIDRLTLSTPEATVTFDQNALDGIYKESTGDIKITAQKLETNLLDTIKDKVGDRPVYRFSVSSGNTNISTFTGTVTVTVPYSLKAGEDVNSIIIYYINANGQAEIVKDCRYNVETKTVVFNTNHFSQYAVGYNKVNFNDVKSDSWYADAVGFVAARSITEGIGKDVYGPNVKLTRAQFLVMVMRAYEIDPEENTEDNFADAGRTYYTDYLAAAKQKGITKGVGNNTFAPLREITRQEMFALLYNVLEDAGELPNGETNKELSDFTDGVAIAGWAEEPMIKLIQAGIVHGSNGKLKPVNTANRAEMAQILYNLFL